MKNSIFVPKVIAPAAFVIMMSASAAASNSQNGETMVSDAETAPDSVLNEVVVTGSNACVERRLLPYTVSVVGKQQLQNSGNTQLLSVLSGRVPSMFVTERGILGYGVSNGGSGAIKLRGVGNNGTVLMMMDGQPQFAGIYSHHIGDFYGKDYVERVEVLRGPGSVLYGSNAMGGVVNVITKRAKEDGVHASLTTQYGSYNTSITSATVTARHGRFTALANGGYDRTDGSIDGMDFKQWQAYAKIGYELTRNWSLAADYTFMNFRGNDPVYPRLSNPESTVVYHQNITRGETSLSASNRYGATDGVVRAYYSYGNHFIDDPRHFHSVDDRFGILAYQNLHPAEFTDVTIGFDFDTYTGKIPMSGGTAHKPGAMATISRKSVTEYSPYLTLSQGLKGRTFIVDMGLRMANSDKFSRRWVPQVGFAWNPGNLFSLKGSAAMGYRNPSFRELYLYRPANPDLEPEEMWNYELSIARVFSNILEVSLTGYFSQGSNMIQVVEQKNINTGSFINKGMEVTVSCRPLNVLMLHASYSYLHTTLNDLTGAPKNQYFLGADWNAFRGFNVSAEMRGVGGLYVAPTVDNQNYITVNLRASYDICRHVGVFVRLDNLTDTSYVINRGYPMPGFTALGGLRLSL